METSRRRILHIDMDAFYASVEQRDHAEYKGKPLVVGGAGPRSVVAAASYEARKYGIHSAMPVKQALEKYKDLLIIPPRFDVYREISREIRRIFHFYTDLVEPLSLDEAYLDITEDKRGIGDARKTASHIRKWIFSATELTASAGISYNKFLAKLASDVNKPNGQFALLQEDAVAYLRDLPVRKFHGIGPSTAQRMAEIGIHKGADLLELDEVQLVRYFGKSGSYYYHVARGIDDREVEPGRERKSLGAERTFERDIGGEEVIEKLRTIAGIVATRAEAEGIRAFTLTLKLRLPDFTTLTRSASYETALSGEVAIFDRARTILKNSGMEDMKFRLIGITLSHFADQQDPLQMSFDI